MKDRIKRFRVWFFGGLIEFRKKLLLWFITWALKGKIVVLVYTSRVRRWYYKKKFYLKAKLAGYKYVTPEQSIMEFPPKKGHKACNYGKGYNVIQLPNKTKTIRFCYCVSEQYKKSGKKYMLKEDVL